MVSIWKNTNFIKLWLGQLVSILGDQIHFIALMVFIQHLFGDILVTGTVMMISALPKVIFSPFAGVLVDRWSLKMTMVISDLLRMVFVLFIPLTLYLIETPNMNIIFGLTFLISTVSVFFYPAKSASVPTLVEKEQLLTANSISGSTQMILSLVGLLGGAVLVSLIGTTWAFIIDGASFLFSAITISLIKYPLKTEEDTNEKVENKYFEELRAGANYIKNDKLLRFMLLFFTSILLVGGATNVLFLAYVQDTLKLDASYIGYILGANMVGMLIGMALIAKITKKYPKEKLLVWSTFIFAVTMANFAWVDTLIFVIPFMVINGLGNGILNVVSSTIFQEHIKETMRGRVFSVVDATVNSAAIISMLPAAWLAKTFGVPNVFLTVAIIIFIIFFVSLKKITVIFEELKGKKDTIVEVHPTASTL